MSTRVLVTACVVAIALLGFAGSSAARVASSPVGLGWGDNATALRGQNGSQFTFVCPAGGSLGSIWGTDVYTDDSPVCTAAVHAGKLTTVDGGIATIQVKAGLSTYTGSARNGVTSSSYGPWSGSYSVVGATAAGGSPGVKMGQAGWSAMATPYRGQNGTRFSYLCPAGGTAGRIWGANIYTDDSSVCTAAVHNGLISLAAGGNVTIEIRPGLSSYTGLANNGITSIAYGAWSGSFVFPAAHAISTGGGSTVAAGGTTWSATATSFRGHNGTHYRYTCPSDGTAGTVWGTADYTDDSSVCTAAVHAGLITLAHGGTVRIAIQPGRSIYTGSTKNGITTRPYGAWSGSFVFVAS